MMILNSTFDKIINSRFLGSSVLQYTVFLTYLLGGILLGRLLYFFLKKYARRVTAKTKSTIDDMIVDLIEEPLVAIVVVIGFYFGYHQLHLPSKVYNFFTHTTNSLFTIAIAWFVISLVDRVLSGYKRSSYLEEKNELYDHVLPLSRKIIRFTLILVTAIIIVNNFGYNVTSLVASLGIGGLAVALAAQEVLKNIFGGVTIITDRPFKLGDYVSINDFEGTIEEIGLRSIRLKTYEGYYVTMPNHLITETSIKNYNRYKVTRLIFTIGLTYGMTDRQIITAKKLVEEALNQTKRVVKNTYEIEFINFNDFSLDLYIACDVACNIPPLRRKVRDSINMKIKQTFDKEGIEIAFPTQTVEWKRSN
ncbi:mechanosensitive ion channel family protein [Microscilla marina]|uniref:Mechanosensitive (MS) ion channel n=1 Tax=Microscilla marina ATCC 23134 TaxID=313606 RepID=A1ZDV8_MICM2|nr:mechanosensitive ion channel family protein [Microscilla marina]EAY31266.1 mechanosensitive (MS) ion channel [Microscilla marina ATCC 23134]